MTNTSSTVFWRRMPKKKADAGAGGAGGAEKKAKMADAEHPIDSSGVLKAAKDGDFPKFLTLLKSQTHLSFEDFNSLPPGRSFGVLHQIAFHGNRAALEALLTAHPRVDLKMLTKDGKTAEEVAVEEQADASFLGFLRDCVRRQNLQELVSATSRGAGEGGESAKGQAARPAHTTGRTSTAAKAAKAANTSVQAASSTSGGMPPEFGKGKEKDDAETAAKTAATMPRKGGPGYLQLVLDALDTLGTASLPKIKNWFASERPEVDFKPHLLKAALKKGIEKGAPPHARVCRSSRAAHLTSLFFPQAPSCRTRPPTRSGAG